jgi:hypothetical protein
VRPSSRMAIKRTAMSLTSTARKRINQAVCGDEPGRLPDTSTILPRPTPKPASRRIAGSEAANAAPWHVARSPVPLSVRGHPMAGRLLTTEPGQPTLTMMLAFLKL